MLYHPKCDPGQTCEVSRCPLHQAEEETEAGAAHPRRQRECWAEDSWNPSAFLNLTKREEAWKACSLLVIERGAVLESY